MTSRFTWLHLTDLHVGAESHYLWPDVEHAVLDDLRKLSDRLAGIDAVFFTGDLVHRGDPAEYEQFDAIRAKILEALTRDGIAPVFLCVPGNHDLARPASPETSMLAKGFRDVREAFYRMPDGLLRTAIDNAFKGWREWHMALPPDDRVQRQDGLLPGDFVATLKLGARRIGVVGLNTTFLQLSDQITKEGLSLDARQIARLWPEGGDSWAEQHDATILITHQPPGWLDAEGARELSEEIAPAGRVQRPPVRAPARAARPG